MYLVKPIVKKHGGRESTKNLQETVRKGENTTHRIQRVLLIQTWNLQKVIVILTQISLHHLTQVPLAMTGEGRGRDLQGKINIDVEKEGIDAETRGAGNETRDQSVDQEGTESD